MILSGLFDHLEESFSYKKVQFREFFPPVKTVVFLLETLIKPLESNFTKMFFVLAIYFLHPPFQKVMQILSLDAVF